MKRRSRITSSMLTIIISAISGSCFLYILFYLFIVLWYFAESIAKLRKYFTGTCSYVMQDNVSCLSLAINQRKYTRYISDL